MLLGCNAEQYETWPPMAYVEGVPIISGATQDEFEAIATIEKGVRKCCDYIIPCRGVFFVRHPDYIVPNLCNGSICVNRWKDYPLVNGTPERVPGEGYSGMCGRFLFISRIGDRQDKLLSLLAHERAHEILGFGHTEDLKILEKCILDGKRINPEDVFIKEKQNG